jgi:hypothetical protein
VKVAILTRNAALNAEAALANGGTISIRSGTQPATPETAVTGTLLATVSLNATAFGAASNGTITAAAIVGDVTADATGTATWFRMWRSDGTTAVLDGSVGTSGADLNINSIAIQAGAAVEVTALSITLPEA